MFDTTFFVATWITHSDEELASNAVSVACVALKDALTLGVVVTDVGFAIVVAFTIVGFTTGLIVVCLNGDFNVFALNARIIVVTDGVFDADDT